MTIDIFDKQNKKTETMELPERIFKVKFNSTLIHQALWRRLLNQRSPLAHAKGKEKFPAAAKPWRQKEPAGQGMVQFVHLYGKAAALHLVRQKKGYLRKKNKKMNRLAIFSVLSKKAEDGDLKILKNLNLTLKS